VAENYETRHPLHLCNVDVVEDLSHARVVLQGDAHAVRFNDSNLLHEQLLLEVDAK